MADNVTLNSGSGGASLATDEIASVHHQRVKIQYGVDGAATDVSDTNPLPIDDAGGSLTVDNAALSVTGGGTEATALRVTLANDSTGVVSIDDNGGSITIDGTVTANAGTGTMTVDLGSNNDVQGAAAEGAAVSGNPFLIAGDDGTNVKHVAVAADGAIHIDDGGNSITVDGTVTANLSATDNAVLDQIDSNTDYGAVTGGGTETGALRVTLANNSTGVLSVDDNGGSITVDNGGTFAVQAASAGDVAHNSADSGNPVKVGAKVETSPKGMTLAADADRSDMHTDADGQLLVKIGTTGADLVSERVSNTDGASTAFTSFSAVASTYNYVTAITCTNTSATDGYVDIRDGTAGSVLWTIPIPGNGGATITCGGTPLFKSSANTALAYDVSAALSTVYISMSGYQSKV